MATVPAHVKVTHKGKVLEQPAFAIRGENGQFTVDHNLITKMANRIGFHPRVVSVQIFEDVLDEAA